MAEERLGRLTTRQIVALSAPALIYAGFEIPMRVFMPAFLAEHVGLSLATIGTILLVARLWDMVNDPMVGVLTDATSTRWGRRRPWIVAGVPLALLGTSQLYFAAPQTSALQITLAMILLYAGWTMIIVPHGAWGVEISHEPHERSRIFGFKMLAVAAALPIFALGPAILERSYGAGVDQQIMIIGVLVAVGLPLSIAVLLAFVPEPAGAPTPLSWRALAGSYFVVFERREFALISGVYLVVGAADAVSSAIYLFLVRDGLGLPDWAATFLVVQALVGFVGIPLWLAISRRIGKDRVLFVLFSLQLLLAPLPLVLPQGQLLPFAAFIIAKGLLWGADYMLLRAIVADLVDDDAAGSSARRAGVFYASFNLTLKLAAAIGGAAVLWLLAAIGFDPAAGPAARAAHGEFLRWTAAAVPSLASLAGCTLLLLFMRRRHGRSSHAWKPGDATATVR
jgi:GPH family glycoside/pentoside/hexuronide:cation symporter